MDRQKQEHWWQCVEISSAEEYSQVTSKLAAELLDEHTPEELAEIAATHMIYVNKLEGLRAVLEDTSALRKELLEDSVPLEVATRYAEVKLNSWRKKQAQRRMTTLHLRNMAKSAAVERAKSIATDLWRTDTAQKIKLSVMADRIYRALAAEGFAESLPGSAERVKEWIKPVAPAYARQGGAPKGARRQKTS